MEVDVQSMGRKLLYEAQNLLAQDDATNVIEVLSASPDYATKHLVLASALVAAGRMNAALINAEKALRLAPNSPAALVLVERCSREAQRPKLGDLVEKPSPNEHQFNLRTEPIRLKPTLASQEPVEQVESSPAEEKELGLVSETLADLLATQGKIDAARKVLIQLSRLHPDRYALYQQKMKDLDNRTPT